MRSALGAHVGWWILVIAKKLDVIGTLAIFTIGVLIYYSASRIGLLNNDWYYVMQAAQLNVPDYLIAYFDPRVQTGWYRPIFGILHLVVYIFWGADPAAHHLAHIVLHGTTAALFFLLVHRVSQNIRIASLAGLIYVGLPVYSKAVYWPSVPDPLSTSLYLLAVWFWLDYVETEQKRYTVITWVLFVLSVMTKETSVTLPITLFLIDRLVVCRKMTFAGLARRYAPYVAVLLIYLPVEYMIQHSGSYVKMANYGFGNHVFSNLVDALAWVAFPWDLGMPTKYMWLGIAAIIFLAAMIIKHSKIMGVLAIFAILNLLPVLGFPPEWFETRYLYTPTMVSAIFIAYLFEAGWRLVHRARWFAVLASAATLTILFVNYLDVTAAVANWGEIARQRSVPFRDIARRHPTFEPGTYLYFTDSPEVPPYDLFAMFLLHYGKDLTVEGVDNNQIARWRDFSTAYLYYFDESAQPIETTVDPTAKFRSTLPLPVRFRVPIRLEGYDLARSSYKRSETAVLLLYWRGTAPIDEDYTVFVHLLDENGQPVDGFDAMPRSGKAPTSSWRANQLVVDAILMPLTKVTPGKNYRVAVGLYYLPTQERANIVDATGQVVADEFIIESLHIDQ